MLRHTKLRALAALTILLACFVAKPVHAACTNPAATEADIIYNRDFHIYQYCNGTSWVAYGGGIGSGAMSFISTQTASNSASLQFTNLPTSYNTLFLNCSGIFVSSNGTTLIFRVGEGAGPTWETGAHYTDLLNWEMIGGGGTNQTTTSTDLFNGGAWSSTFPVSLQAYAYNVGSSSLYKNISINEEQFSTAAVSYVTLTGWGYWNNDTNPITGLQLLPASGNITSGTCSLYGMN